MKTTRYTEQEFIEAVKNSYSIAQVLKKIGVKPTGGNYKTAKMRINKLNLDTSHFTGQGHLKGKTHGWSKKIPLEDILVKDSSYKGGSYKLKNRLITEGKFEKKCYSCGKKTWLNRPIPLELEHKNGQNTDNRLENLSIICPNCHALTPTYRGKNKCKGKSER